MRESKKFEGTQLPQDTFEEWVRKQAAKPARTKGEQKPLESAYESWISKRVEHRRSSG
jgi:hypothetical protein